MAHYEKPDASAYMALRKQDGSDRIKVDDFVGGSGGMASTGRSKLTDSPKKKTTGYHADVRVDDWMGGSPGKAKRSWKIKSKSEAAIPKYDIEDPDEPKPVSPSPRRSSEVTKRWQPPPKDDSIAPPWMASPTSSSSPRKWQPKSPSVTSPTRKSEIHSAVPPLPESSPPSSPTKNANGFTIERPDAEQYKQLRHLGEPEGARVNDYVGSSSNTGRTVTKKYTPKTESNDSSAARVDDWAGGTTCTKAGYKVKTKKTTHDDDTPSSPTPSSPVKESGHGSHTEKLSNGFTIEKPDAEQYKQLRHLGEPEGARVNDFVGSSSNTGRTVTKKWTPPPKPEAGDNAARVDEWAGGTTCSRPGYKVKSQSLSALPKHDDRDDHRHSIPHHMESPTRRWKPPPKDEAIPPPWVSSPTYTSSPMKWKPKSPSKSPTKSNDIRSAIPPLPHSSPPSSPTRTPASPTKNVNGFTIDRPDADQYKQSRFLDAAGAAVNNDYVGSSNNTGRTVTKRWSATKPDTTSSTNDTSASRVDDWAGGTTCSKAGYKVKTKKTERRDEGETPSIPAPVVEATPEPEPEPEPEPSQHEEEEEKAAPEEDNSNTNGNHTEKLSNGFTIEKPNADAYKQLRTIDQAGAAVNQDFVGSSSGYTGRTKIESKKSSTRSSFNDSPARVDDWAGGRTCTKKGYKIKGAK